MSARPVLLLRAPTGPADAYDAALRAASFSPRALPVLETTLLTAHLAELIHHARVDGAILTSARAVDAWAAAADAAPASSTPATPWPSIPFYTVGPRTATALRALAAARPARAPLCPGDVRGAHTGSADALARFVLADTPGAARLLYLTGDKNRDTLARVVAEEGGGRVELVEEQVYATQGVPLDEFERELQGCMDDANDNMWIVFFAPSSAAHVLPVLRKQFRLARTDPALLDSPGARDRPTARVAAIGPTTADFLRDECALVVHAVPDAPNAEALARALSAADTAGILS